jgi:hypothetical protein
LCSWQVLHSGRLNRLDREDLRETNTLAYHEYFQHLMMI